MKQVKYLIIGAGISGLAFAVQKQNENYLILEKDIVPGGLCKTFYDKGFVWDVAGHFFHFHSENTKNYYEKLMAGKMQARAIKCAKVYYKENYMDAPFQYNIHQLPQEEFLECLTDLYYSNSSNENIPFDLFVEQKYGKGIANKFLIPYNEKLYACKMNELEKDSMGNFLPQMDFGMLMNFYKGLKGKTYNDTFLYPVNGCMEVINSLIIQLNSSRIHLNEEVIGVDVEKKLVFTEKETYHYEYLINTSPLNIFLKMIEKPTNILTYNQVLVLNFGFDRESIDKTISWVYYPGNEIFYRVGFYNNIAGTKYLSIYVEISYKMNEKINIELALKRSLEDLKKVGVINEHKVIAQNSYIVNPGYVHITNEGKKFTNMFISSMRKKNVYMIGRYAKWEYSAMDDSLEQAFELSKEI